MKKILLGGVALSSLLTGISANAADLPPALSYKALPARAPVYNWTGCYVGANGGYAWNKIRSTYTGDPNLADPIQGAGSVLPPSYDTSSNSWLAGGQVGCNWQSGWWVFGIEGDIDGMNLSKTVGITSLAALAGTNIAANTAMIPPNEVIASEHVSQHWLSTVRGRLGFAPIPQLYIYGTGGLAVGEVSTNGSVTGGVTNAIGATIVWSGSSSATRAGFAIGGGAEYAVADHWSLKGEYIFFDLGTVSHPLAFTSNVGFSGPFFSTLGNTTTRINGNIVRVGLNYQFR